VISLNLVLAGLRLGLKNRQVGEKWDWILLIIPIYAKASITNMNKLNLKIIAPIFVALLMSTIWILSSKNNTGEAKAGFKKSPSG
jgi:hypothetical protein